MSDDIREELTKLLREHQVPIPDHGYPLDEYDCCAAAILDKFLVVPRDQVITEYVVYVRGQKRNSFSSLAEALDRSSAYEGVEIYRRDNFMHWAAITIFEEDEISYE